MVFCCHRNLKVGVRGPSSVIDNVDLCIRERHLIVYEGCHPINQSSETPSPPKSDCFQKHKEIVFKLIRGTVGELE